MFSGLQWENRFFFAEVGTKKVCTFIVKEKMDFSEQGTDYLELHFFDNMKFQNGAPNWPNFQNVCNKNWPTLGTILGPKIS